MYDCTVLRASSVARMDDAEAAAVHAMLRHGGRAVEAGGTSAHAWLATAVPVPGGGARLVAGIGGMCHHNCLEAVAADPSLTHLYGYALSADGCWYEHSWLADALGVVETTAPREAYLGVPLADLPRGVSSFVAGADWLDEDEGAELDAAQDARLAHVPAVDREALTALIAAGEPPHRTR